MTSGARPVLKSIYDDFGERVQFVSVYVREAHPGENYPHHESDEQKMRQARDWVAQDNILWTVAVDSIEGEAHKSYGSLPNPAYLIDRTGHVAFRALWAGQEGLLRSNLEELLRQEDADEGPVVLGQQENLLIPLLRGSAELDYAVARGGEKSKRDFREGMGGMMYAMDKLMSKMRPVMHRRERR
jgi:hypothetical protein